MILFFDRFETRWALAALQASLLPSNASTLTTAWLKLFPFRQWSIWEIVQESRPQPRHFETLAQMCSCSWWSVQISWTKAVMIKVSTWSRLQTKCIARENIGKELLCCHSFLIAEAAQEPKCAKCVAKQTCNANEPASLVKVAKWFEEKNACFASRWMRHFSPAGSLDAHTQTGPGEVATPAAVREWQCWMWLHWNVGKHRQEGRGDKGSLGLLTRDWVGETLWVLSSLRRGGLMVVQTMFKRHD